MNKVLIIDDDIFLTELYVRLLKNEGLEVDVANSGAEALVRIADFCPHLVVLDLHMPGMNGTDVLRAIRNDSRFQCMPVIIFATGYEKSLMAEVGDLGPHKVFSKMKCKPRVLVAEIKDSLECLKREASQVLEARSGLEAGAEQIQDPGKDQLSIWLERLRTDVRPEALRVCLLYLYRIMLADILRAKGMDAVSPEGALGLALEKLMEELYENPQRIQDSTVESLEQACTKLLVLGEECCAVKLDSEAMLQDVLKRL